MGGSRADGRGRRCRHFGGPTQASVSIAVIADLRQPSQVRSPEPALHRVVHARSDRRKIFCPGSPFLPPFVVSARDARFKRGGAEPSPRRLAPALRAWLRQTLQTTPRQTLQTNLSCHPPRRSLPHRPRRLRSSCQPRSGIAPWLQP